MLGAAGRARHDLIRELGAMPIDGREWPLDEAVRRVLPGGVDSAFDGLGGRFVSACVRATHRGGVVVGCGFSGATKGHRPDHLEIARGVLSLLVGAPLAGRRGRFYGITLRYLRNPRPFHEDLATLFELLAAKAIRPRIAARLPLLAAREASERLERGGVEGKIVHLSAA